MMYFPFQSKLPDLQNSALVTLPPGSSYEQIRIVQEKKPMKTLTTEEKKALIVAAMDNDLEWKALEQMLKENKSAQCKIEGELSQAGIAGKFEVDGLVLFVSHGGDYQVVEIESL